MIWLSYLTIHREIRGVLADRLEHGATDQLDRKLITLIEQQRRVEWAGVFMSIRRTWHAVRRAARQVINDPTMAA